MAPGVSRVRPAIFKQLSPGAMSQGPSALRAYRPAAAVPLDPAMEALAGGLPGSAPRPTAPRTADLEQRLAPLRGISRELVGRGMPGPLVAELMAEIVAEYGQQVLASERDARLAFVEQLLLRIPSAPLVPEGTPLKGAYLVTGPAGSGKSVLIAHLALLAARQGQSNVVLVNTESARIGAAAQANALGAVFSYEVEHVYTPQELRELRSRRGARTVLLIETAGWSPRDEAAGSTPWKWQLPGTQVVVCVPATAQAEDLSAVLTTTQEKTSGAAAALCKTSETRNVLPALGALALARQPLGLVTGGPNLADPTPAPDLGELARAALGVVLPQRRKGRVR